MQAIRTLGISSTVALVTGCFNAELSAHLNPDQTVELGFMMVMTPEAHDFMGDEIGCPVEWVFDGEEYVCKETRIAPLDIFLGEDADDEPIRIDLKSENVARVRFRDDFGVDPVPPEDLDLLRSLVSGDAVIFRLSGKAVESHIGGSVTDDGTEVFWRIPLIWLLSRDDRLKAERSAVIQF